MTSYRLYAHNNAENFGKLIADKLGMNLYSAIVKTFADGELNVTINESVRGRHIIYIANLEMPYDNFIQAILFCDAARRASASAITMVIPYLIHSRQERRDDKRSPITARLFADILEKSGIDRIISMDIHTSAIEGFYRIPFDKIYPTDIFVEKIKLLNLENPKLVAPDAGFAKKMKYYSKTLGYDMALIDKDRIEANQIESMTLIGNVKGHNVIIIDDMIDTAKTLVRAADKVLEEGAISVTVFGTHGILSHMNEFDNAILRLQTSKIKKVFISNTICTYNNNQDPTKKIQIIDVSEVFANAINKIITEAAHLEMGN